MDPLREIQPLSYTTRRRTFLFLLALFMVSLPFLFLYATGYRFDLGDSNSLVRTGGIYVAAERTGAQIYIDDELVRETRVFRTAFYAQNLEPRTHRVHVQKEGHHTWVKELPVTSHRVTEAQAFNMPLVPQIRVVSEWVSATGSAVVRSPLPYASTTNEVVATTTKATSTFLMNPEFITLRTQFIGSTTATGTRLLPRKLPIIGTTTSPMVESATSTRENGGVRLSREEDGSVYATWIGPFEQMPYYYCAKQFPRYSTSSLILKEDAELLDVDLAKNAALIAQIEEDAEPELIHPVEQVDEAVSCDRRIKLSSPSDIRGFEFFPGSTDLVILELADGIYVSEIDARAWQNVQPLLLGKDLNVVVENGAIYIYDGYLIYQVLLES